MGNFEKINQLFNDYFGISLEDNMKKKKDEVEMHVASPSVEAWGTVTNPAVSTGSSEREERIQTCERAICGVLDRLDVIEAHSEQKEHDQIFRRLASVEDHIRSIDVTLYELKHKEPAPIFEELEERGLAERCEGVLVLTMKGRQVASLFDNGEIEDIRGD
jgi:hypothetical protein